MALQKVLVSRCLLGENVRYDGGSCALSPLLQAWLAEGRVVPLCPEVAGGLPTPRPPAEIAGGQGAQVLVGQVEVRTEAGEDVSAAFIAGAEQALALVAAHGIRLALLKANSPSCGNLQTYDGSFSRTKVSGEGVTAAALRQVGVHVFNETQWPQLVAALTALEQA